jgi:HSP20 family protein
MANIAVQKDQSQSVARPRSDVWEPTRMLRSLLSWDPFREMEPFMSSPTSGEEFVPAFDVKETADGFHFRADVPGVKDADLSIQVTGNRLTIAGKRETEDTKQGDTYYSYERSYGSFTRAFTLPEGVDIQKTQADLKDGVLSVIVPKRAEQKPQTINIKTQPKS